MRVDMYLEPDFRRYKLKAVFISGDKEIYWQESLMMPFDSPYEIPLLSFSRGEVQDLVDFLKKQLLKEDL